MILSFSDIVFPMVILNGCRAKNGQRGRRRKRRYVGDILNVDVQTMEHHKYWEIHEIVSYS